MRSYSKKKARVASKRGGSKKKNSPIELKNKVLIVVDVQNCFFENFGTMGWIPKGYLDVLTTQNEADIAKMNKARDDIKREFIRRLKEFIEKAMKDYDLIIFTKDRHPIHHRSFGTYPPHCIDDSKTCNFRVKLDTVKKQKHFQDIFSKSKGHKLILIDDADLEKLFYDYKISFGGDINKELEIITLSELNMKGKIKYEKTTSTDNPPVTIDIASPEMKMKPRTDHAAIVRLSKGELCNFDAYGAFMYHIEYKNDPTSGRKVEEYETRHEFNPSGETNILNDLRGIDDVTKISTGLGEFLIKYYDNKFSPDMVIDVCGLVTNICVVNSCIGGVKFFENYNKLHEDIPVKIPHFRILNEFSLYLYLFPLSEKQCLKNANISFKLYPSEDKYISDREHKLLSHFVSIIGTKSADGYTPYTVMK